MNIRNNIVNYLFDRDYIFCLYDDYAYFFNYRYLDSFDEKEITVSMDKRKMTITGADLTIIKMTKEELLVKGRIEDVKVRVPNE